MGMAAKADARMRSEGLPRRSRDLNVLDYSLWHAINERMREEEKQFPANRKDTKEQHLVRLRATALGLPRAVVEGGVGFLLLRFCFTSSRSRVSRPQLGSCGF